LGLRVARGFQVTLFADANLADDIYSLTLDSRGNVVVSGPGYIRTLLDDNGDGAADRGVDFAKTPSGSMGMAFDGPDLLFVGDGALWRFRDTNGDGQADGEPERLLGLRSAEHGGHAVRRGPEGLWYILGGNDSKLDQTQVNATGVAGRKLEG